MRQMFKGRTQDDSLEDQQPVLSGALPLVGHGVSFARNRLALLERARALGPGTVILVPDPVVVVSEPDDVQHVLVGNPSGYVKGPKLASERGTRVFGAGLLTQHGTSHRRLRLLIQPAFHRLAATRLEQVLHDALETTLRGWQPGTRDVHGELMAGARLAIQRVLFGELPDAEAVDRAIAERRAFAQRWFTTLNPRPEWLPTPANLRYRRTEAWFRRRVAELVDERLAEPEAHEDLLALLVASRDRSQDRLSRDELITEALSLTIPGHETTGESLAWTLDLLARHPEEQERARASARVHERATLERIVDESLRLYPPTWVTVRVATADDTMPSGTVVRRGRRLYLSPWLLHRDARWWKDPDRFDPDRFLSDADPDRPRRAYLPFGAGPRVCIGERLAKTELIEALLLVLPRFELRPVGRPPTPDPGLTLSPRGGVPILLEEPAS